MMYLDLDLGAFSSIKSTKVRGIVTWFGISFDFILVSIKDRFTDAKQKVILLQ